MRQLLRRLWYAIRQRRLQADLAEEMEFHRTMKQQELEDRGIDPTDARFAAKRALGSTALAQDQARDVWIWRWLQDVPQDVRYALRTLRKSPGFTTVAILTLALGIGANTTIFSVVNGVLVQPLPFKDSDRIVHIAGNSPGLPPGTMTSVGTARDLPIWRASATSLSDISVYGTGSVVTTNWEQPVRLIRSWVSPSTFPLLGVRPLLGRVFQSDEETPGAGGLVILSYSTWQHHFSADPGVLGRTIDLDSRAHVIVGVMPSGFSFPSPQIDLWTLAAVSDFALAAPTAAIFPIARVKDGVSFEAAATEANTIARQVLLSHFSPQAATRVRDQRLVNLVSVKDNLVASVRPALLVLMAAVGFVLLIACCNVASLLLARAASRQKEIAIRVALGAGRGRVVRQVLTEGLILAFAGGATGIGFAFGGLRVLTIFNAGNIPRLDEVGIDVRVLVFTVTMSMVTGLLFGLAPARRLARTAPVHDLKGEAPASRQKSPLWGGRRGLTVVEVAMAMVLLVGAALLIRSFMNLARQDLGYDPDGVLTFQLALPRARYPDRAGLRVYEELLARLEAVPSVRAAAVTQALPGQPGPGMGVLAKSESAERIGIMVYAVSRHYLNAIGVRPLEGRSLGERDEASQPPVLLVNSTMARQAFPHESPLQKTIQANGPMKAVPWEIVGVVADAHRMGLDVEPKPTGYVDIRQWPPSASQSLSAMYFIVRTTGEPTAIVPTVRSMVHQVDPQLLIDKVVSLDQLISSSVARPRSYAVLVGFFAGIAVVLAVIGIYGLMAYAVTERTREIGVRMALGAQPRDVVGLVLGQGLLLTVVGIVLGLTGAAALTRYLQGMLFGLAALDPGTFIVVTLLFTAIAMLASYVPARRATRVDPLVALRCE